MDVHWCSYVMDLQGANLHSGLQRQGKADLCNVMERLSVAGAASSAALATNGNASS